MTEEIITPRLYIKVWVALLVLLGATVGLAYLPLGRFHAVAAVTISFAKAILIALFFMQIKYKARLVWVVACSGVFWLGILFALALTDFYTRSWLPSPSTWIR